MHKRNTLISQDLLPVHHAGRKVGMFGYFSMWVGFSVIIATFALGGDGVQLMNLGWVMLACLLGNIALGIFISITGDIGTEHGLAFPVYMRAPFGIYGTHIPSLVRGIIGAAWFGIQTYFGALAINYIIQHFTGFDNWFLWYVVFAAVQVLNAAFGIKAIEKFADIAAPAIIIISIWLYIRMESIASDAGLSIWNTVAGTDNGFTFKIWILLFFANMAYWSTYSSDVLNLTRYVKAPKGEKNWFKRNKNTILAHVVALPITQTFMIIIGGATMVALGMWNPIDAIQTTASGFVLVVLLLLVILAQWSTNSGGNLLPAAVTIANAGATRISYATGVILAGILGSLLQPWAIMDSLINFLLIMSGIISAIAGVLFADYYLIRKRRVNVPALYKQDGQFKYFRGWNMAGMIAWIAGGISANILSTYAYIVGFLVACIVYYVLAKYWWFKIYKQAELEETDPEKYLGLSVGRDWVIDVNDIEASTNTTTNKPSGGISQ